MRSRYVLLLVLVLIAPDDTRLQAQRRGERRGEQPAGQYGWIFSLQAGQAEARKSGKPLMVVVRCQP